MTGGRCVRVGGPVLPTQVYSRVSLSPNPAFPAGVLCVRGVSQPVGPSDPTSGWWTLGEAEGVGTQGRAQPTARICRELSSSDPTAGIAPAGLRWPPPVFCPRCRRSACPFLVFLPCPVWQGHMSSHCLPQGPGTGLPLTPGAHRMLFRCQCCSEKAEVRAVSSEYWFPLSPCLDAGTTDTAFQTHFNEGGERLFPMGRPSREKTD